MNRFLSVSAAIAVAALTVAGTASAQVASSALPAPPTASNAASSSIFDALLAIARAADTNPAAVGPASLSYKAAIQQYHAGDLVQAQRSAFDAISQTGAVALPMPRLNPPVIPQQTYLTMPAVLSTDQADAESYVALARKAVMLCGGPGPVPDGIQSLYTAAVGAMVAKNTVTAKADSGMLINQCASAESAYASTLKAMPAPSSNLGSYNPAPIATLGPDPALAATPQPMMTSTATPVPQRRGFRL